MATAKLRSYEPGDLICKLKPYIKVIERDSWETICSWCLKHNVELKSCSRCKMVKYCGATCQNEAWEDHKLECPFLPRYIAGPDDLFVQMVAKLILKTKGKDWKNITDVVMEQNVSFDYLKSQSFRLNKPFFKFFIKEIETALKSYLGEENVPNEEKLIQLIGKVDCNNFSNDMDNSAIMALSIGVSKFDHSCVPNAILHFTGTDFLIRAIKKIDKSEKVTFSNRTMFTELDPSAHVHMQNTFGERECCCSDCSQPYGRSPLTMILDPLRAIDIIKETEDFLFMASLMAKYQYPMELISQRKMVQLLRKQEGVLGDTHLSRIKLLALKCLLLSGNAIQMRRELMILEKWVKRVWGENYEELNAIYMKLVDVNAELSDAEKCAHYVNELIRVKMICFGEIRI